MMSSANNHRLCSLAWPVALLVGLATPAAARSSDTDDARGLDIYFVDVLGGAATLIVTPSGESILVDTGWPGFDDRDPKRIVHVLKDVAGLQQIDHLVTTHWHTDHYGGVEGLSKLIEIRNYWDRGLPEDQIEGLDFPDGPKSDNPLYLAYKHASEGKRRVLRAGQRFEVGGGAEVVIVASGGEVISPEQRFPGISVEPNSLCSEVPPDRDEDTSDNARSVAFVLSLGDFQFFDGGDLTWNIERALVCPIDLISPTNSATDLYQVTHHGMDISNHPTLLRTLRPTVTIMNNGPRKGGSAETVERLRAIESIEAAYQLHRNVQTGPGENTDPAFIANLDETGGQFIHVHVDPDGSAFSVRIGADGEPREFTSR